VNAASWAGNVACMRAMRSAYKAVVGKCEGERLLRRPKRRRKDNIKTDVTENEDCLPMTLLTKASLRCFTDTKAE
jgi:hypothetical protein